MVSIALSATLLRTAMQPTCARACSGPCPRLFAIVRGDYEVAEGGITLLHCSDCVQAPQPLEAVDASGAAHAGELSELAHERPSFPLVPRTYFVWRPAQPLPAGVYRLRAVTPSHEADDDCSLATFDAEIHVPAPAATQALPDPTLTLGTANRPAGTVFECRDRCDPARLGTRSLEAPYLEHRIAVGGDHPARARYLVRLLGRTEDGPIEEGPWWSLDAVTEPTATEDGVFVAEDMQHGGVTFRRAQAEYCGTIELLDVVSDTRETLDAGCVQHTLPSGRLQTVPAFGTCEGFESGTMAQYVEAFCGDNAQDCAGGDWRCDEWRRQCTTQPDPADAGPPPVPNDSGQPSPAQSMDASLEPEVPEDEAEGGGDVPDDEADEGQDHGAESDDASSESPTEPLPRSASCRIDAATAGATARWPLLLLAACLVYAGRQRARRRAR